MKAKDVALTQAFTALFGVFMETLKFCLLLGINITLKLMMLETMMMMMMMMMLMMIMMLVMMMMMMMMTTTAMTMVLTAGVNTHREPV